MQVHVRYFAVLRERKGCTNETVVLPGPLTVGGLYASLFPPTEEGALPVMYAVNQSYVGSEHSLTEGDEVAFIPPLGGG